MILIVGCRRAEKPSLHSTSVDDDQKSLQREDNVEANTTKPSVTPPHVTQDVSEIPFPIDQEIARFEEEIEAFDREIKALESIYSEQDELVRSASELLTNVKEIPDDILELFNERHETNSRIKALEEQRRFLIKAEEQRRRKILEK